MRSLNTLAFLILALILLSGITVSFAAGTWTGNVSTDWGDAANWSGTPPGPATSSHDMIIPTSPSGGRFPILSSGTYSIKKLNIQSGASFTQSGGSLTLNDNLVIGKDPSATYNQTGGIVQMKKDWTNEGIFNANGGTVRFSPSANGGAFNKGSNQFFNIEIDDGVQPPFDNDISNNILISGNFENNNPDFNLTSKGTFTFNGSGDQTIYSASTPLPDNSTFVNLVIDKPSGALTLLSEISVENSFTPTQGYLDLNGNILYVNGEEYTGPLPVELVSFSATISDTEIILNWLTATEVNNYGFEVQRSVQTDEWELLGFVEGHGNSNSLKEYNFIDSDVNSAGTYSYRLKQIDNDGSYEFSKTIEVNFGSPINFELSQNYPNPFNPTTTISFTLPQSSNVALKVFNSIGEEVVTLTDGFIEAGVYTFNFNADGLASGMYLYSLSTNGFTETKKMLLVK